MDQTRRPMLSMALNSPDHFAAHPMEQSRGQGLHVSKTEADKGLEETKEVLLPLEAAPSGAGPSD